MNEEVKKTMEIVGLSNDELKFRCPSIFTTTPAPHLSEKYSFVPTIQVIEDVKKLGWIPTEATQVKSRKSKTKGKGKHMITFEHEDFKTKDDEKIQMLLINSHDGTSNFQLEIGVFRLVCSNGLVIKDNDMGAVKVRHLGYSFKDITAAVNELVLNIPNVFNKMNKMKETELDEAQMAELALKSACARFNLEYEKEAENLAKTLEIDDLLGVDRREDKGNGLYEVFNRVQEKLINGGFEYLNERTGKYRKARPIKNFQQNTRVNQELWGIAESFIEDAELVA